MNQWWVGVVGAGILCLVGCRGNVHYTASDWEELVGRPPEATAPSALPPTGEAPSSATQTLQAFTVAGTSAQGSVPWRVSGQSAAVVGQTVQMTDVHGVREATDETMTVTAKQGTFDPKTHDVHLEHDVVATTADGMTLTTDALDWSERTQTLTMVEPLTVTQEQLEITGTGGVAHPELKTMAIAEQVRVTVYPSTIITCEGPLEVDYDHAKATFHEDVHVTDERGELFADQMEVFFNEAREVEQIIAIGHVRILRGDDTAYSDRAVYLQKQGQVFLTGEPRLVLFPRQEDVR